MPEYDIFHKALFCTLASSMNLGLNAFSFSKEVFMKRFYFYQLNTDHFGGFNAFLNKLNLKGKLFESTQLSTQNPNFDVFW